MPRKRLTIQQLRFPLDNRNLAAILNKFNDHDSVADEWDAAKGPVNALLSGAVVDNPGIQATGTIELTQADGTKVQVLVKKE